MKNVRVLRRLQLAAAVVYVAAILLTLLFLNLSEHNWKELDTDPFLFAFGFPALSLMYFPLLISALAALRLRITRVLYTGASKILRTLVVCSLIICFLSGILGIFLDGARIVSTAFTVVTVLLTAADALACRKKAVPKPDPADGDPSQND